MTDWDGHAPKNHMTSLEQWERELRETAPHVLEPLYVDTQLLCHKRLIWPHSRTARRLTGTSGDQSLVEKQRQRSHAWRNRCVDFLAGTCEDEGQSGLRSWKKASENRTLSLSTDTHVSPLAQAQGRNTAVLDKFEHTPSQIERAQGSAKEGPKGGLALHEYTFRREHLELLDPGESETTASHREEARADNNRTLKQLRRAPARRSCLLGPYQDSCA